MKPPKPLAPPFSRVSAIDIASVAVKLCELTATELVPASDDMFRAKFALAYDVLVDADLQLQNLGERIRAKNLTQDSAITALAKPSE